MRFSFLFAVVALLTSAPAPGQRDAIAELVTKLERAATAGDREGIRALGREPNSLTEFAFSLTTPAPTRVVIRERDRTRTDSGVHRLLLEVFWERGLEGRLSTWSVDMGESSNHWRVVSAARLANVSGLYRLTLNRTKQFDVRDLTVRSADLTMSMKSGSAFVAETPEGVTGVVLVGRGDMRFAPPDGAERSQLRIFAGAEQLATAFDAVFLRVRPEDFSTSLPASALTERQTPSPNDVRRANDIFDEYVGRSLQINLVDLSPDRWWITPQPGDLIAEIRTDRFGSLTYTKSTQDPEDITLFDRKRRRNISVYASAEKLATRGRFYSDADRTEYDVLDYDVSVAMAPERGRIEGVTRIKLLITAESATTLTFRLAEALRVVGVFSSTQGRLLHLRVINQNSLIVGLPAATIQGSELTLNIIYAGDLPPQELDREAIAVSQDPGESLQLPPEPRYLYSNRTYWYPQSTVSDYATATLRVTVPEGLDVVATGSSAGPPAPPPGVVEGGGRRMFIFQTDRPVRYLACVISRFRDVANTTASSEGPSAGVTLNVQANGRQVTRARASLTRAMDIFNYYSSIIGDAPYPSFTVVFTERELPGGHSPAFFAVVDQPMSGQSSWRNDPVNFDNYPAFFLAHEIAHQWWGQGLGWKNYHEQWLSEGFAQYFAALYAERKFPPAVISNVLRQMRQTAIAQSEKGPVYLGYRLGHIQGDTRVFRAILYNKSAMVLHMLRRLIGDDAFFTGVRTFYTEFKFKKAGTGDLMSVMEKASGRDLSDFFENWIFRETVPSARFSYKTEGSRALLRIEQLNEPAVEFPVRVQLTYASGETDHVLMVAKDRMTETSVDLKGSLRSAAANADHGALVVFR